ncbi:MAG: IS200/IS605 family element transposase accessory protein TnpB [Candidatus Aenigmarchaeota archaeon]|nr:IS200/IS605 family element transposase accessory protein TnpB [Candidatus Aenigmarchaeota archaeon]
MKESKNNIRMYRYRIYPSQEQRKRLDSQLASCKELYNLLLQKCKEDYKEKSISVNRKMLYKLAKQFTDNDERYSDVHSQVLQNVADRLVKSYKNYFRRIKEKKSGKKIKVGFPRFKKFYSSITYPQSGFNLAANRLFASRIGNIPIVTERLPQGKTKTLTIRRKPSGKWFVFFSSFVDTPETENTVKYNKIGIDMGIENFATLSDGTTIENPRFLRKSEDTLAKYQRRVSRKAKGSNRIKAKIKVARIHEKITNQRTDFLHKTSKMLTEKYSFIAVEKLNVSNMVKNHNLAKSISDASWNQFTRMIGYKASSAGCQLVFVNPRNTSQICSGCGNTVKKELSDRWHECDLCGLSLHRDHNSALEILDKATDGLSGSNAFGDSVRPSVKKVVVDESGTTRVEIDAGNPAL